MISFVDIIFLLILVAVIITRLYGVLGANGDNKNIKVVFKNVRENLNNDIYEYAPQKERESMVQVVDMSEITPEFLEKNFDRDTFLKGACRVFEMILSAFNRGELPVIKDFVSKKVYDALNQAHIFRKKNEMTSEVDFICFDKAEVKNVKMLKNSMKVVVEFVSEQVNLLRDAKGEVIEGDENFIQKITDVWTFERNYNAKNGNWVLVSTKKTA